MTMLSPVAREMRASASGSRERLALVGIDDGLATHPPEQHDLVLRGLLVEQPEVVEVGVEVLPHPADVGQTDRLIGQALVAGGGRLAEHHGEVDQQVLVRQRDAHGLGVDGAEHGQRFSGQWARHDVLLYTGRAGRYRWYQASVSRMTSLNAGSR